MANHTVPAGHIGAYDLELTAGQVDTVTFTDTDVAEIEVMTDGTADIYVTFGADAVPTVQGSDCWRVPAAAGITALQPQTTGPTVVKLISSGTPVYSVARAS